MIALGFVLIYKATETGNTVAEIGAGLASLGFQPGQVASVLANTCREWVWADLAIQTMGGVCNGIYPTDAAAQVEYLCVDSDSCFLFVEDDEQLDKFLKNRARLPQIQRVIVFNMAGLHKLNDPQVISLDALRDLGRAYLMGRSNLVEERLATRGPNDLAVLVCTSGTTGRPKGAMITHADRMKDIIITAGGKNVTPSEWENQPKFSPYVTDAVVIGDQRAYLSCLVMIDEDNLAQWAQDRDVQFSDFKSLCRAPEVIKLIGEAIEKVNRDFARVEQIKQFRLIEQRLTAADEELTPTMKLKRSLINRKYAALIEGMYSVKAAA